MHAGAATYTNMSTVREPAPAPVPEDLSQIENQQHHTPLTPTLHELSQPFPRPSVVPGARPEDRISLDAEQQEDLQCAFGDPSLLLCESDDDDDLGLTSDDSVLCLQSLLVLPPTHDTDMPATPTPTFESSSYFAVPISKPRSRSYLQPLEQPYPRPRNPEPPVQSRPGSTALSVSLFPISLFARPLSTATTTDLDSPLEEEESGESDSAADGERVLARERGEEGNGDDEESGETEEEKEEEEGEEANASPSKQIAVMRSKLGEIRNRLSELTEYSESSGVVLPSTSEAEGGEEEIDNALGRADGNDELKVSSSAPAIYSKNIPNLFSFLALTRPLDFREEPP